MQPRKINRRRKFLSTPSARRATPADRKGIQSRKDFYPRPPRGGRLTQANQLLISAGISIHALREEGDNGITKRARPETVFLSTPSARRATYNAMDTQSQTIFLSTPSARRATSP